MGKLVKFVQIDGCYILILIATILLVYYPTFFNDFIYMWDDQWQVFTKTTENGFNWGNIVQMFSQSFYSQYFPVNQFFYMLVYVLSGGYNAFAFHLFCLFVHALNTVLVYYLIKKCLLLSERIHESNVKKVSFLTALLFAVHPLNVESVAWVSASKVLIYSFFFLLALYAYVIYYKKKHILYLLYSLIFFICSYGAKEQAVILPVCLFLFDWFLNRDFRNKKLWLEKIPFFILSFCMGCFTLYLALECSYSDEKNYIFVERIIFSSYSFF